MRLTANEVRGNPSEVQILSSPQTKSLTLLGGAFVCSEDEPEDLGGSRANSTTDGSSRLRRQNRNKSSGSGVAKTGRNPAKPGLIQGLSKALKSLPNLYRPPLPTQVPLGNTFSSSIHVCAGGL